MRTSTLRNKTNSLKLEKMKIEFVKYSHIRSRIITLLMLCLASALSYAQSLKSDREIKKKISPDLFGLFFEDINYSADGGLYAEMVQNRSFEYAPGSRRDWNSFSHWEYVTPGFSYGSVNIETNVPVHPNNPHYVVLNIEHVGKEEKYIGPAGVGMKNAGFDGMVVREGNKYKFSMFARQLSGDAIPLTVTLQTPKGKILAEGKISTSSKDWKNYSTELIATANHDTVSLVVLATSKGMLALDVISLFPEQTFKHRTNGLRPDLAQALADMKPRFIRFPGGCLVHGDGLGNMYRWKNSIGPVEQRVEQKNIWGYHQTVGLGYFEYFQFCEDIGAKPLPVLPAAVSCQNSGGTWQTGGTGQRALPMDEMKDYIQEVLDLIEWANGPVTSTWGAKRAAAGHPAPFNLEFVGIGNEDKITAQFEERFKLIFEAVKAKHPEITIIGTVGPFPDGEDFTRGWKYADHLNVPMVDEHYYKDPTWMMANRKRYDTYDRKQAKVYLGEYASWGNKLMNAIAEAAYMIGLERNGDVVHMASYAPLFAKKDHTQWKPDMIFFDNTRVCMTPNYHVQKMFSVNQGDVYFGNIISKNEADTTLAASCVQESKTGDVILKMVNAGKSSAMMKVNLNGFKKIGLAQKEVLTGEAEAENTLENPMNVVPVASPFKASKTFEYAVPPMSLIVIRIKTK
jgi:alpha-L-arabinofuranosidase